jgi:hypothetical protein
MAMVSHLPPLPPCSYIQNTNYQLPSYTMSSEYPQNPPPKETQYHMPESIAPHSSGSLQSIFYTPKISEGSDASRMHSSEINLVDKKGKRPISFENNVGENRSNFIDLDLLFDSSSLDNENNNNLDDKVPHDIKDTLDAVIYGKSFHPK